LEFFREDPCRVIDLIRILGIFLLLVACAPIALKHALFILAINCHNMKVMAMTSLNISLPEALKQYVETQVATGDWGTPSEYVRELIRQDKERRLSNLEQELIAATKGPKIELSVADVRKKGLLRVLREHKQR